MMQGRGSASEWNPREPSEMSRGICTRDWKGGKGRLLGDWKGGVKDVGKHDV